MRVTGVPQGSQLAGLRKFFERAGQVLRVDIRRLATENIV